LKNYENLSDTQIEVLLQIWPKSTPVQDLLTEKLEEGQIWNKAEKYFVVLAAEKTVHDRLMIWNFINTFDEKLKLAE
jgi:hypothetical protein